MTSQAPRAAAANPGFLSAPTMHPRQPCHSIPEPPQAVPVPAPPVLSRWPLHRTLQDPTTSPLSSHHTEDIPRMAFSGTLPCMLISGTFIHPNSQLQYTQHPLGLHVLQFHPCCEGVSVLVCPKALQSMPSHPNKVALVWCILELPGIYSIQQNMSCQSCHVHAVHTGDTTTQNHCTRPRKITVLPNS